MNKLFLLLFLFCYKTNSQSIKDINSNVYFKPKLNYFSKEKTGLSILVVNKAHFKTINNPFFSKSGYYIDELKGNTNYKLKIKQKYYLPNHHGKINLMPFPKGKHKINILWKDQNILLNPNIKEKKNSLQLVILPDDDFPTLIGEYNSSTVMNMGYKKIYKSLKKIKELIKDIQIKKLKFHTIIDPDYRDKLGKSSDFIEYLKIHYKRLEYLKPSLIQLKLLEKSYLLTINGKYKPLNSNQSKFRYKISLNKSFKIISYQED
ncbi:MAG: hypothetical protein COB02_00835 [Candidatus Cloacimonadota bacterium]|nr:MAG: hypothetical protein COB02_00835 [Candidatus Cloacimonadota bacterium]